MVNQDSEMNRGDLTLGQPDPSITSLVAVDQRELLRRQVAITYDTCGYFSLPGTGWTSFTCYYYPSSVATTCSTYSGHIGCQGSVRTRCYVTTPCGTTRSDELCCYTACVTVIKANGNDELTMYPFCATKDTEVSLYKELRGAEASTTESSTEAGLTAKTAETTSSGTGETASTRESAAPSSSDSGDSSSTPVGAIVGGVVGGLALLALIGFGLWFVRHKKRQAAQGSNIPPATHLSPAVSYYQQQPVSNFHQGVGNYGQPYNPGMAQVEPKDYPSAPNPMSSPATELPSFTNEAQYPSTFR